MLDASIRTYIIQGNDYLAFGNAAVSFWLGEYPDAGVVAQIIDLAPAHVQCGRLYIGPIPEDANDAVLRALTLAKVDGSYEAVIMHDDYSTYGAP